MKTLRSLAVATALAFGYATPVLAQQSAQPPANGPVPLSIAVVDIDQIRREATAVIAAREQINKYHAAIQAEIQKEEVALRDANQELARQRTVLSPEAFNEERRKFEQRLVDVQRTVQERREEMDNIQNDVMRRMNEAMAEVVSELAQEQKFGLILRLDQTVFAADPLLITKAVLERLNKKLPSIKVAEPASLKGGKAASKAGKAVPKAGKAKDAKKQ